MARYMTKSGFSPTVERTIVWHMAHGCGIEEAARKAGLSAGADVNRYRRTAAFADDLKAALRDRLATEIAPKAIDFLQRLMLDPGAPARCRVDAAKALLDRGGFRSDEPLVTARGKDLRDMTKAEIDAIVLDAQKRNVEASGEADGADGDADAVYDLIGLESPPAASAAPPAEVAKAPAWRSAPTLDLAAVVSAAND